MVGSLELSTILNGARAYSTINTKIVRIVDIFKNSFKKMCKQMSKKQLVKQLSRASMKTQASIRKHWAIVKIIFYSCCCISTNVQE